MRKGEQKMGIDYFCIETDIKDDDKVFDLRYHYATLGGGNDAAAGYAAFGRLIDLLADIYREGFAAVVTEQKRRRLMQQLGLSGEEFDEFISTCVDVGLFDKTLWDEHQVLTSHGIQKRYYIVANRRSGKVPDEHLRWLLIDDEEAGMSIPNHSRDHSADKMLQNEDIMQHDAAECTMMQQNERIMLQNEGILQHSVPQEKKREEKKREEKKKKEEEKKRKGSSSEIFDLTSSLAKSLASPLSERKQKGFHIYPLVCMSHKDPELQYLDSMDVSHETPWDALVARLRYRAPHIDVVMFAESIAECCPANCSQSDKCSGKCYEIISRVLDKYNRDKCSSPIPLISKVLKEDRGF